MLKRRRRISALLISLMMLGAPGIPDVSARMTSSRMGAVSTSSSVRDQSVPGELLVTYKSGASASAKSQSLGRVGAASIKSFKTSRGSVNHVRVRADLRDQAIAQLKQDPQVLHVQPNFIYRVAAVPNDPKYGQLWGLKNTGQTVASSVSYVDSPDSTDNPGVSGMDMGMEAAWDYITDCSSVVVAVVDTGVNYTHEDLSSNMWNGGGSYPNHGWDFVGGTNDPIDLNGHGTHVAGTIGAVGNNSLGGTGVCWKVKIMALRALDATGSGTTSDLVQAVDFATAHGAKVINMSLGGLTSADVADDVLSDAITSANSAGITVVVAAGNDGLDNDQSGNETYPCNFTHSNLICVAALDQAFALASFSNYGAVSVDVGAPGVNIVSSWAGQVSTISDSFNTSGTLNWTHTSTTGGGWGYQNLLFSTSSGLQNYDTLSCPVSWDGSTAHYNNNTDDRVYKAFNIPSANTATLNFLAFLDTQTGQDYFNIGVKAGSSDPFTGGTQLDHLSGSTGGSTEALSYDLSSCLGATCTVGFQLTSGPSVTATGVAILDFSISTLAVDATHYNVIEGTSMATPHVAGLAAMLQAYNPLYTPQDIIDSIKNGGVARAALSGLTTTGRSVSAIGSLTYIGVPKGLTATPLP